MTKKTSKTNVFSITDFFGGKVKRLTLTIQDAPIYESPENKDTLVGQSATVFGTLQLIKENDKKNVTNINFTLPLNNVTELKQHVLSMIEEAMKLKEKSKK